VPFPCEIQDLLVPHVSFPLFSQVASTQLQPWAAFPRQTFSPQVAAPLFSQVAATHSLFEQSWPSPHFERQTVILAGSFSWHWLASHSAGQAGPETVQGCPQLSVPVAEPQSGGVALQEPSGKQVCTHEP
jgi:hypothetical protein